MTAKIITVVNQKGGVGKTTITMQLGGTFGLRGFKVLIVDADPQNTASRWAASAEEDKAFPAAIANLSATGAKIHQEIKKFIDDYDVILVDCPPSMDSPVAQSSLVVSDLAIIPIIPSPADFWATSGIKALISMVMPINDTLQSLIVINNSQTSTILAKDVVDALSEFEIPIAKNGISQRTAFRKSSLLGQTVHGLGGEAKKAIEEIDALADEVLKVLGVTSTKKKDKKNVEKQYA